MVRPTVGGVLRQDTRAPHRVMRQTAASISARAGRRWAAKRARTRRSVSLAEPDMRVEKGVLGGVMGSQLLSGRGGL